MTKEQLREHLLSTAEFIDNKWFRTYVELVYSNKHTERIKGVTQSHHILPVAYFKDHKLECDNSAANLVNLLFKEHVRAHCLLCLCSKDDAFGAKMFAAVIHIINHRDITFTDLEKLAIQSLDEYQISYEKYRKYSSSNNVMFDPKVKEHHDNIMRSDAVRNRIADTMRRKIAEGKLMTPEHRATLSAVLSDTKYMTHPDGRQKRVKFADIEEHILQGWILGRLYPEQLKKYLNINRVDLW